MAEYTTVIGENTVRVDKVGGGTLGRAYDGDWEVQVSQGGVVMVDDILTTGTPKTHTEVAWLALDFVEDAMRDGVL